jgi:hypothetical protein
MDLGIRARVRKKRFSNSSKDYYYLDITNKYNTDQFFEYINKSDSFILQKAKEIFPWKFDLKLKKRDFMNLLLNHYNENERKNLIIPFF